MYSYSWPRRSKWEPADFITEKKIVEIIKQAEQTAQNSAWTVLTKARKAQGLTPLEAAVLLQCNDPSVIEEMFAAAAAVKEQIYGKRIVLFAPLYISDYCVNNCVYCGYRQDNNFTRRRLTQDEVVDEVKILLAMGHKRIALEAGEHPEQCPIDYVLKCLETIYKVAVNRGKIRRCNVNIAATTIDEYRLLKGAGIGTYILFQETYHRDTYARMHPSGPKADYDWHTTAHDRAMLAGIDDVGLGVLFGLYDYKFELLALLLHARHLEKRFGVGPHTVSVPRLRQARGVSLKDFPYLVDDLEFRKIVAVIRLALPYTGIIISTREQAAFRDELLKLGVSQISAGSCTGVGAYRNAHHNRGGSCQFDVGDQRSPEEVLRSMCSSGWLPSYCTACYRQGRTGDRFMSLAKTGNIQKFCQPNALLTFKEYLLDYASPETRRIGEIAIRQQLTAIRDKTLRQATVQRLRAIEKGKRDMYF